MMIEISSTNLPMLERIGQFPLQNPTFDFHYRSPAHTLYLHDYAAEMRIGDEELTLQPGDITCISGGTVYSISSPEPGMHWCIQFLDDPEAGEDAVPLPLHLALGRHSAFQRQQIQVISRLGFGGEDQQDDDVLLREARFRLKALLLSLHNLARVHGEGASEEESVLWEDFLAWLDENLHVNLPMPALAGRLGMSAPTLARKFKQAHRCSLLHYLLQRRIDRARSLLATTTLPVHEVGEAVGIPDPQYFNKQFRKVVGSSPSAYREQNAEFLGGAIEESLPEDDWHNDPTFL